MTKQPRQPVIQPVGGSRKAFAKPQTEIHPLPDEALQYLTEVRKLSPKTLDAFGVGYCPKRKLIAIPYNDENAERRLVRFRHPTGGMIKKPNDDGTFEDVKTYIEKGGKGILLGSNLAHASAGPLIITFGDYDAMSLYEAGIPNAVALPFGDGGFEFIDHQWNFLQQFEEFIFFPDIDEYPNPEVKAKALEKREELYRRLDKARCMIVRVEDRAGVKDPNALLVQRGPEALQAAIENAIPVPEEHLVRVADDLDDELPDGCPFGFSEIDKITGGANPAELILISGDSGTGKTTVTLNMIAEFIEQQRTVFYWTGEQTRRQIKWWFERIAAGDQHLVERTQAKTGKVFWFPHDDYKPFIRAWYGEQFWQYDTPSPTKEKFFEVAELAIRRHGAKMVVIDNLMAFTGGEGEGYYQAQGDFAESCKNFARRWDVTVILICHDKKVPLITQGNKMRFPQKADVEGSKKITNWGDQLFQTYKIPPEFRNGEWAQTDGFICLNKLRDGGYGGNIPTVVSEKSNRIVQLKDKHEPKMYGWENLYRQAFSGQRREANA